MAEQIAQSSDVAPTTFPIVHGLRLLAPLLMTGAMLLLGLWLRWPNMTYRGEPTQDAFNRFAFNQFTYSDIASLFYRDQLASHPRPFFDYALEYPVGMGVLIYLLNFATTLPGYFLATSIWMALSGLLIAWLVARFPNGRIWLVALSPSLALYVNLNWDMWGVLLTVLALLLFVRRRDSLATGVLAAAVWTKFFPIVLLPLIIWDRIRHREWRTVLRISVVFGLASLLINGPLLLVRPAAWWHFFSFNRTRGREVNLWSFFDRWQPTTEQINQWSAILLVIGLIVLLILQWLAPPGAWLPACCAMLAWFFFINKVYSPQYSLWIVVFLAVVGAAPGLAAAWSAIDLIYFAASFMTLGLLAYGDAVHWFVVRGLMPAMALREGMLLIVIGWCIWAMYRPSETRQVIESNQHIPTARV